MNDNGLAVDDWIAICAAHQRQPTLTVAILLAYQADRLLSTPNSKARSQVSARLISGLRDIGWDTAPLKGHTKRGSVLHRMAANVRNSWSDDDPRHATVRARPVLRSDLDRLTSTIEQEEQQGELTVLAAVWFRALIVVAFSGAFRCSELVRLQWQWLTTVDGGVVVTIPTSKHQRSRKQVYLADGQTYQVSKLLANLRSSYDALGVTSKRVFVEIPRNSRHARNGLYRTDGDPRLWLDNIAEKMADDRYHPDEDEETRHYRALVATTSVLMRNINWLFNKTGFDARTIFERPSSHGFRRGCATELWNRGINILEIAKHLRHHSGEATSVYIEDTDVIIANPMDIDDSAYESFAEAADAALHGLDGLLKR